jgi:anti-sigma B factor antagonist
LADAWPYHTPLSVGARPVSDGVALVTVAGEVDIATVESLRVVLSPLASDETVHTVVCDLSQVTFLGGIAVSALLDARRALAERAARLRLVATSHAVLRPLSVLNLLDVLPVSEDVQSAVE